MITFHVGYEPARRRYKLAEDIDTMAPDCKYLGERTLPDVVAVRACIRTLEEGGNIVCVDTADETGEEEL